jgi:transposase
MPAKLPPCYIGLDIAKDQLDYCLSDTVEGRCAYTPEGCAELIKKLRPIKHARVICEASGGYEKLIVAELLHAGLEVCVVQPGRVRALAYAEGLMAKTDRIDARLLRRFGEKVEVRLAPPADPALITLRELLEHRRQLTTQLVEVNGRMALAGRTLRKFLEEQKIFLESQIQKVDKMIDEHIDPKDSGKTIAPRHVRGGRAQVRHVLYMAAVCAARSNPILAAFYQHLRAKGKPAKVCLVAVMRKLACLMNKLIQNPNFALAQ